MHDIIASAMDPQGQIRIFVARTTKLVEHARAIHQTSPTATAALGRFLTGAALMGCTLKNPTDSITLQIRGDGPLGGMTAVTDAMSQVKGYVHHPLADVPLNEKGKFDIAAVVGKGTLGVIKDLGMREPWSGQVELISGEIAEDLTWYFATSEQTPTVVTLGVLEGEGGHVKHAGGMLVQVMPGIPDDVIDLLEARITALPPITALLSQGKTPEEIINLVLEELGITNLACRPTNYYCNCSRERMERNLISLGKKELTELSEDNKGIELCCHFCSNRYHFSQTQTKDLFEKAIQP